MPAKRLTQPSGAARTLNLIFPHLNNIYFDDSIWERGFFCLSFGDGKEDERVEKYIEECQNDEDVSRL
ncbi:MAG: transposase [Defluviitaleaceae bacterium]|nr:transposase [Defluviitaleaceae bacterium]